MKFFGKYFGIALSFALFCTGWLLFAQKPIRPAANGNNHNRRETETRSTSERVETALILAKSAPPEVAIDILFTLLSSNLVGDKQKNIEVLEEAFRLASTVREPVKRRSWSRIADTRAGFKQMAFDLGLDKLSIQSKVVLRMLPLDRFRARTMFSEITLPSTKSLTCDDSLVYDLDPYYQTMFLVAEQGFSEDEKRAGGHVQFLLDGFEKVRSIAQENSITKVFLKAKLLPGEIALLTSTFVEALDRVSPDPRSFAFAMDRDPFLANLHALILKLKEAGLPVKDLTNATRRFLVKNLSEEVCSDAEWIKSGQAKMTAGLERINIEFTAPITTDDMRPSKLASTAIDVNYWTTPKARAALMKAKELRFGGGTTELSVVQRQTDEWQERLHSFLALIKDWDSDSEASSDDYFQEKCNMYRVLVELCPDDAERDLVLRTYGDYLRESSSKYKGSIEWIFPVREYLRVLRSKSDKARQSSLDPWLSSSDSNLRVYAEIALLVATKS